MKKSLLTLMFFILVAVANVHAQSGMEKEILRHLDQIQKMGEDRWKENIELEKKRLEAPQVRQNQEAKKVSDGYESL